MFVIASILGCIFCEAIINAAGTSLEVTDDLPPQNEVLKIPKIFHTIWIDFGKGNEIPPKYIQNMRDFELLHSGWSFKNWTEPEIVELIKFKHPYFLNTFLNYDAPIKKHDSARIIVLDIFGGVYIDHDFIPLKNIEILLKSFDLVLGNEVDDEFVPVNGFIGSIPDHPFLKKLIKGMNCPVVAESPVLLATGPFLLKETLLSHVLDFGSGGIKIYSRKFFYPIEYWNKTRMNGIERTDLPNEFPESYLIQQYDTSWRN